MNLQICAGKPISWRSLIKIFGMTLSNALSTSRKIVRIEALRKKAKWMRAVRVIKLSVHDRELLKPD